MGETFSITDSLVGAAIALFSAILSGVVILIFEKKMEARKDFVRDREIASALAFSILARAADISACNRTLKRAIDECFSDVEGTMQAEYDPGIKVVPIVGFPEFYESLSPSEMSLILRTGDSGLLEELLSLFRNFLTTIKLVAKFNLIREEYSRRVTELAKDSIPSDHGTEHFVMDETGRRVSDAIVGNLNVLVAEMINSSDNDLRRSRELVSRLQTAFREIDGLNVPTVKFEEE